MQYKEVRRITEQKYMSESAYMSLLSIKIFYPYTPYKMTYKISFKLNQMKKQLNFHYFFTGSKVSSSAKNNNIGCMQV